MRELEGAVVPKTVGTCLLNLSLNHASVSGVCYAEEQRYTAGKTDRQIKEAASRDPNR